MLTRALDALAHLTPGFRMFKILWDAIWLNDNKGRYLLWEQPEHNVCVCVEITWAWRPWSSRVVWPGINEGVTAFPVRVWWGETFSSATRSLAKLFQKLWLKRCHLGCCEGRWGSVNVWDVGGDVGRGWMLWGGGWTLRGKWGGDGCWRGIREKG